MRTCPACRRGFVDTESACPLDGVALGAPVDGMLPDGVGRILGSYRLVARLAEGSMGTVYIGAHTRLKRYVAVKVLKPALQHRRDAIARFFDEANTVNRLHHPNIVESIDFVEDHVDGAYCVLELLHGTSLRRRLVDGPVPVATAVHVAAQIADALSVVHAQGIVHRDLKPDNLILLEHDFVKLIDFGVAQIGDTSAAGAPFGTAAYMAPEQAAGEHVDGRADVYALGVLLFEMLTGIHPFPSKNDHEFVLRHADDTPPRPSRFAHHTTLPKQLDAIILRCLAKRPEDRFQTAAAVASALRAITPVRRRGGWLVGGALAAVGAITAVVLARSAPAPAPARTAAPAVDAAAVAPPPAPPETITLRFTSTPPGARVVRSGETVPLGMTPFEATLARADRAVSVRFELEGYEPADADVTLAESTQVAVVLDKRRAVAPIAVDKPPPPKPVTRKLQREGVMDPFARE